MKRTRRHVRGLAQDREAIVPLTTPFFDRSTMTKLIIDERDLRCTILEGARE